MLLTAKSPQEREVAACVIGRLRQMDPGELESLLIDEDPQPLLELGQSCAGSSNAL
jgi:uncharacterized protein (DUF2249 family)